jgi:hypothetical protein
MKVRAIPDHTSELRGAAPWHAVKAVSIGHMKTLLAT